MPSKAKDKANAITVGDHTVTNTNVKNAHRCPAANVERKSKQANHPTALARTMKARIGPHSEGEPRSSLKEPCNGDSGTLASSEANRVVDMVTVWLGTSACGQMFRCKSMCVPCKMITRLSPRPVRSVTK